MTQRIKASPAVRKFLRDIASMGGRNAAKRLTGEERRARARLGGLAKAKARSGGGV
jgi:hypothetical protein